MIEDPLRKRIIKKFNAYKAERHYYDPVAGTYEVRAGRNRR